MTTHPLWQYVVHLKPQLRGHVEVIPHVYRGERWYVLHDHSSKQYLRFNEHAYAILGRFDGDLTLEEILDHANETQNDYPFTQEDVIGLLGQLDAAEVLKGGLPVNAQDVFHQYKASKKKKRQRSYMNPLSIKLPLLNPDRLLTALAPLGKILFSTWGLWIWGLTLMLALLLGLTHAGELKNAMLSLDISSGELLAMWLIYPFIKAMHELGHGLALKTWGGEVSEMGINLLIFMPVPYVDATDSYTFSNKWRRMAVGAAGIFVELFLASLALFLWLVVEPGIVKDMALNVIIIATFSTLLFNGNPLMRYDGYFVFEDWLEIPNLATRAKRYYYYLIQKYILKISNVQSPVTAAGEKKWFLFYGFAAPVYRFMIMFSIALYLVDNFLVIGVALATWTLTMQLIIPLIKGIKFLLLNESLSLHRARAIGIVLFGSVIIIVLLSIPVSLITYTEGVVWTDGNAQVTAGTSGFVEKVFVPSNTQVDVNQSLIQLHDDALLSEYKALKYHLNELQAEYLSEERQNRTKAAMLKDDIDAANDQYKALKQKINDLEIKSMSKGKFIASSTQDMRGQYVHQGDTLGYIINDKKLIIKAVVPQARIGLLESYETEVDCKFANDISKTYKSRIIRQTPQATGHLASAVLGTAGGGIFPVDRRDKSAKKLLTPVFEIDLVMPKNIHKSQIGGRVYVRLNHGKLSVAKQLALRFNQLFLRHFYHK